MIFDGLYEHRRRRCCSAVIRRELTDRRRSPGRSPRRRLRAFGYGFGAVLLGATLTDSASAPVAGRPRAGAVVAGTVARFTRVGRFGDRFGRRRCYVGLYVAAGGDGRRVRVRAAVWLLVAVVVGRGAVHRGGRVRAVHLARAGDAGRRARAPAPRARVRPLQRRRRRRRVARRAGRRPGSVRCTRSGRARPPTSACSCCWFRPRSPGRWSRHGSRRRRTDGAPLAEPVRLAAARGSRPIVLRLAALFAWTRSAAGSPCRRSSPSGFRSGSTPRSACSASCSSPSASCRPLSFLSSGRLAGPVRAADDDGVHPSAVQRLADRHRVRAQPAVAIALLLLRTALSQMDVPTRQAYVMALVEPDERTARGGVTNTARYLTRPLGADPRRGGAVGRRSGSRS